MKGTICKRKAFAAEQSAALDIGESRKKSFSSSSSISERKGISYKVEDEDDEDEKD